jgi:hypothetical protein
MQDLKLDYILKSTQKKMKTNDKCDYIVKSVKKGRVIIFEGGLDPKDEVKLLEKSMMSIDHEKFFGIKLYSPMPRKTGSFFKVDSTKVTIVTPAYMDMNCKTI